MEAKGLVEERIEEEVKASDLSLLVRASVYCSSAPVQRSVTEFHRLHVESFTDVRDEQDENSLEHSRIFALYVDLLDGLMDAFLSREGASQKEFMMQCQDVIDGKFCALFEENEHAWFVDLLHSWTDFPSFKRSMISFRRSEEKHGK